jgi:CRP/FNR family transcriptional regulator, cyclic AMP receptor protein
VAQLACLAGRISALRRRGELPEDGFSLTEINENVRHRAENIAAEGRSLRLSKGVFTRTERGSSRSIMPYTQSPEFDAEAFLAKSGNGRKVLNFQKGQTMFAQGERANAVFYIRQGQVKISVISEQGKEAVVALLKARDFFGEGCLVGQLRRQATAEAMSDCEIMRLDKAAIMQAIHEEPEFAKKFIAYVLVRSIRTEADLVDQLFNSSEKRLARTLLLLANFGKEGRPEPIVPKISQEMLAEMVGTTRPRISEFMNKFRKLGYISYNGHLEVHSSLLNVVLNDPPYDVGAAEEG